MCAVLSAEQVLLKSFLISVNWETEGAHFRFKIYCGYDPGDDVYDNATQRLAVEAKAQLLLEPVSASLQLVKVGCDNCRLCLRGQIIRVA